MTPAGVQMFVEGEWIGVPEDLWALPGIRVKQTGGTLVRAVRERTWLHDGLCSLLRVLPPNPTAIFEPAFALREGRIQSLP